ncbi:MAG: Rrf2 family transcriptional regulator [Dethiobacter sp.]|jgi:Rrf2 family protein|nr:Rrf2 family transcriptional regulator [Dethiobacter sp.]
MKLSAKGEYGVRALVILALDYRAGPVPLREIAERENISYQFLEQIFAPLRRAGLIESVRGAKGGYTLARAPEKIKVGDIVRTLEGPIAPVDCVVEGNEGKCGRSDACLSRGIWEKLRDRMSEVLDEITLADVIGMSPIKHDEEDLK